MIMKRETLHEFQRMEEAQGPAMEGRITLTQIQAPGSVGTTSQGKKEDRWKTNKEGEPDNTIQPPPIPPKRDTQTDEKVEGKDEHLERPLESKPSEKVIIHDDHPDQTITIGGNLFEREAPRNQNFRANHKGKHKSINGKMHKQAKLVQPETIAGMIIGNISKKRPREQSKQWLDNEISFPSTPGCQLVNSPIILEALIEGFLSPEHRWIETMIMKRETLHECRRMEEAQGPAMEGIITLTQIQAPGSVGTTSQGKKEDRWKTNKEGEPDNTIQPPPIPPKRDTRTDEKVEGKDEHLERPLESKPSEKIRIEILRKHTDAFAWTLADMTGISCFIAEHELKSYPYIESMVQRKQSIAPDRRRVVKDEVAEWIKAGIVRKVRYPTDILEDRIPNGVQVQVLPRRLQGNAGATLQRLVDTIFGGQIGRNLKAYINDMVIKSKTQPKMIKDVEETLLTLKRNQSKSRKSKGRGKHAFTKKPETNTPSKMCKQKGLSLDNKGQRSIPRNEDLITELPTLTTPKKEEELMVYLSATNEAVSAVILVERHGRKAPIHYKEKSMKEQETPKTQTPKNLGTKTDIWKLYTDVASNENGSGAGLILIDSKGAEYSYALRLNFTNLNNNAEYEALLAGLRITAKIKVKKMHAFVDSKLVASQVEGSYKSKKGVLIEELNKRSVDMVEVNAIIEEATRTWMTPIQAYIEHGILSEDVTEARMI
nr:hypothetical protein [Tanacetum cinerariifolium]